MQIHQQVYPGLEGSKKQIENPGWGSNAGESDEQDGREWTKLDNRTRKGAVDGKGGVRRNVEGSKNRSDQRPHLEYRA